MPKYYFIPISADESSFDIVREDLIDIDIIRDVKGHIRRGIVIASSVDYWKFSLSPIGINTFFNNRFEDSRPLTQEDCPLYLSSLKYVTPEFEQLMKGVS